MPLVKSCIKRRWREKDGEGLPHYTVTNMDTLSELPEHITESILYWLPSKSVTALRLVSRSVAKTPFRQVFWRSRFWTCNELRIISEA